jgi:EpsI family protein
MVIAAVIALFGIFDRFMQKRPGPDRAFDISALPMSIEGWKGYDVAFGQEVKDILETEDIVLREYADGAGSHVGLAVVYYADSERVALHLPESCLMGKGSRLAGRKRELVNGSSESFSAMRLTTEGDRGKDVVIYYFQTGGYRTASYFDFRSRMVADRLANKPRGGALVRVSTAIPEGGTEEGAVLLLHGFIRLVSPELDERLK